MLKRFLIIISVGLATVVLALAQNANQQNSNLQTMRTRTIAPKPSPTPKIVTKSAGSQPSPSPQKPTPKAQAASEVTSQTAPVGSVLAAFNTLLEGIRHADVKAVMNVYQNTPRLVLFNYNGTVTRGWDQVKENREASYPEMRDVKLEVKDLRVTMLGRDAALITCLWTQSMIFRGTPETDTGRMTIVFRKVGKDWKAIHLHTSGDNPDPSRIPPSEQTPPPRASPTP